MVLVMLKWELEGFLHTHIFQGNAWAWFGASVRVSLKSTQLLARAPGDVKRSARSKRFLNGPLLSCSVARTHTPLLLQTKKLFFLLKMFLVPQTRNICLGWTRHVVQPARLPAFARALNGAPWGIISLHPAVWEQQSARLAVSAVRRSGDRRGGQATMLRPWAAHWIAAVLLCGAVAQYSSDQCNWRGRWGWSWAKHFWSQTSLKTACYS